MDNTYLSLKYNSKERWLSYWYQISETLEVSPRSVLVIGKGSGVVENSIRQLSNDQADIITLDINNAVNSDIVGEVTGLPFGKDTFDAVLCCQVLEHIPFDMLPAALSEMHRVARKRVVISVPHGRKHIKIAVDVPFLGDRQVILKNPVAVRHCSSKQHYWEIGRGVSLNDVVRQIGRLFEIEKEYLNEISCDHRFFILKRKKW
ncbi:MAG: class I SAM-dependent methyltransferase [Nitrospirae bacterium]|nr:class I SAM-dependent methyltransferase [Nitrospirota bacterium]